MEYIYAALILHSAGKEITEEAVTKVMTAAGIAVDDSRVKALIAALDGVDIAEAIEKSAVAAAPVAAAAASAAAPAEAAAEEEDKEKEKEEEEESGMAGLGALFG
ncbi:large subunit ribosomal protein L12 [Methanomicrobium sp. W14]|uniref:50S ribosomal protein P1 n=1 Tax=Methanomicrobium sp. W14 TaxID=2817839 RepID=UPI001AEA68AC|nr:50S ribosomal protein P1 [Methanomicrobium sp. W14]MBP2133034.1 large subunit ribosomal protein L12 [Methanomicrobium sp. W14]